MMEAITVAAIVGELRPGCVPGRVQSVLQTSPRDVVLAVRGPAVAHIMLSARPAAPSIHLAARKPRALPAPTAFCRLLRKHLGGLVLSGILNEGLERTVGFTFAASAAEPPSFRLAVELMGRWSNIVLIEGASGRVVDALRHVTPRMSRKRTVLPGEPYRPPPSEGRLRLDSLDRGRFLEALREGKERGAPVFSLFLGLGPGLAALAGEGDGGDLFSSLRRVIGAVAEAKTRPVYYPGRKMLLPLPVPGWDDGTAVFFGTMNEAADHAFRDITGEEERGRLLARLRRDLKKQRRRRREKLRRLTAEADAGEEQRLRAAGQALLAALGEIPRGARSFDLRDPEDPQAPARTVELDPALGARQNAEAYFRRAKKARRRAELARARLPAAGRELERIEGDMEGLSRLSLEALRERCGPAAGAPTSRPSRGGGGKGLPAVREYRSGQWRILVGKNSRGNDYLTSKVALPDDHWFHARDYPGAHVVLKGGDPAAEPPGRIIEAAGEAAAWHSAARGESLADVSYTRRKYVRKIGGQPPGRVLLPRSKTVRVRPRVPEGFREITSKG